MHGGGSVHSSRIFTRHFGGFAFPENVSMAHAAFQWQDPFLLDAQLSDDERMVRDAAAAYCQNKLLPRVTQAFRNETTDPAIFREMGELGLLGPTIPEAYGGPALVTWPTG
jgi:glutaryl-CoA dehydrogenase